MKLQFQWQIYKLSLPLMFIHRISSLEFVAHYTLQASTVTISKYYEERYSLSEFLSAILVHCNSANTITLYVLAFKERKRERWVAFEVFFVMYRKMRVLCNMHDDYRVCLCMDMHIWWNNNQQLSFLLFFLLSYLSFLHTYGLPQKSWLHF